MNPLDEAALARLRELAEKATPWSLDWNVIGSDCAALGIDTSAEAGFPRCVQATVLLENWKLMVAANPATVLALLDMVPQWRPIETALEGDGVREAKRKAWHVERHDDVITRYRHTCGLTLDTTARDFWLHCPACDPAPPGESGA